MADVRSSTAGPLRGAEAELGSTDAITPLLSQSVCVKCTEGRNIYYGVLIAADGAFLNLINVEWGWYGGTGWWRSGKADTLALPTGNVAHIVPGRLGR